MIGHALTIVRNELRRHMDAYPGNTTLTELGNVAEVANGVGNGNRDKVLLSLVNIQEERTLKNVPHYVRDDAALRARYENPPTFLNLAILVTATHQSYDNALRAISRALLFFQYRNVFTHENVHPDSITVGAPAQVADQLERFKLIFNLWSPTMEEINDMWGMLGGKQFPFALYSMRMLELQFRATQRESGLITEVVSGFSHKPAVVN